MVKRLLSFFHREVSGLHEAAYLLAFFAFLAQLLALLRDRLFAYFFGAGNVIDVYYAAFRIPDFIFVSIATTVSISVLVPFFIEKMERNKEEGRAFIDHTFSVFFFAIVVVSIIAFFLMPWLTPIVLPGFANDPALPQLVTLSRILLLSPLLLGFSNFLASITQIHNRFFLYALSPVLYNLGIVFGIIVLYPTMGLYGLGWGVIIGAALHLCIQIPYIVSQKLFPRVLLSIDFKAIRQVVLTSLPRTLTLSSNQIALFFLTASASLMASGSIAIFNFSNNLQSVPLSIIGVSYASAAFPTLSRLFSTGDMKRFVEQMVASTKHIIFWSMPVMVLFIVLRAQIVRTVLGTGHFDWSDTRLTAAALAIFTLSIIPQSLITLFVRAFYSGGKTLKPLLINLFSSGLIVVFAFGLVWAFEHWSAFRLFFETLFKVEGLTGTSVLMLALAYSLGVFVNTIAHWQAFHKEFSEFSRPVFRTLFQTFSASVLMGFVTYRCLGIFDHVFRVDTVFGIFMQGFCSGIIGIIFCLLVLKALKSEELEQVWRTLHTKIWKADVLVPEPEQL
ncbi:MAG: lipid II flippase MurJ [Patescibacteria group bacterium]